VGIVASKARLWPHFAAISTMIFVMPGGDMTDV
jgi:hypothetical protein